VPLLDAPKAAPAPRAASSTRRGIDVTTPVPPALWDEMLASDPESLAFQSRAWVHAISSLGEWSDATRLYEFAGGRRFLLPLVRRERRLGVLSSQASMPAAWGTGGLVGRDQVTPADVAAVLADLADQRVLRTSARPNPLQDSAWGAVRRRDLVRVPRRAHILDLSGGFDNVWSARFKRRTRNYVRVAEKAGLDVEYDTTGRLVPAYYRLYELSLERWASRQREPRALARWRGRRRDPERKLAAIAQALRGACKLWLASLDGQPVAGVLVVRGANASYTRGAMDPEIAGRTRANYLLHRLAIEDACDAGCRRYHMGETGNSADLAFFKERFGAVPVAYGEYHLERLPITACDRRLRHAVKATIGFRD
jgi:hypothetical protein